MLEVAFQLLLTRQLTCQGEQSGVVGYIAGCKKQSRLLLVYLCQLLLQLFMIAACTRDVPGATSAYSMLVNSFSKDTCRKRLCYF